MLGNRVGPIGGNIADRDAFLPAEGTINVVMAGGSRGDDLEFWKLAQQRGVQIGVDEDREDLGIGDLLRGDPVGFFPD